MSEGALDVDAILGERDSKRERATRGSSVERWNPQNVVGLFKLYADADQLPNDPPR
jgi:hypothetical protein